MIIPLYKIGIENHIDNKKEMPIANITNLLDDMCV